MHIVLRSRQRMERDKTIHQLHCQRYWKILIFHLDEVKVCLVMHLLIQYIQSLARQQVVLHAWRPVYNATFAVSVNWFSKQRHQVASDFEHVPNPNDIAATMRVQIALKSAILYTRRCNLWRCNLRATKNALKTCDQICTKIACVKGPWQSVLEVKSVLWVTLYSQSKNSTDTHPTLGWIMFMNPDGLMLCSH